MKRIGITVALVAALLLATPGLASAVAPDRSEPCVGLKIVDAVLVRPPSLVASIAASALGVVVVPFTLPFGTDVARGMSDDIFGSAWRFTFKRPLGDFSD